MKSHRPTPPAFRVSEVVVVLFFIFFVVVVVVNPSDATLARTDRNKKKKSASSDQSFSSPPPPPPAPGSGPSPLIGPIDKTVYERGLVTVSVKNVREIVENHAAYSSLTSRRNFDEAEVLGYVTPWNGHGYDVAKTFARKFTMISPVWLQVVPRRKDNYNDDANNSGGSSSYVLSGLHDVDKGWVSDLRKGNPDIKVVVRILFDHWMGSDYVGLFTHRARIDEIVGLLDDAVRTHSLDGIVLEFWSQLGGQAKPEATAVVRSIGSHFELQGHLTLLAIPPPPVLHTKGGEKRPGMFDHDDFENLVDYVDFFSLMTYDYSNVARPGPNAPTSWIRDCIESLDPGDSFHRKKILLGMNFYGYDFTTGGGGPILGRDFVELMKDAKRSTTTKLKWDDVSEEHFLETKFANQRHTVFFPSLHSVQTRLLLARELKLGGVAIWELGQGLDYFYDLL